MGKNVKKIVGRAVILAAVVSTNTGCSRNEDAEFGISDTGHRTA